MSAVFLISIPEFYTLRSGYLKELVTKNMKALLSFSSYSFKISHNHLIYSESGPYSLNLAFPSNYSMSMIGCPLILLPKSLSSKNLRANFGTIS